MKEKILKYGILIAIISDAHHHVHWCLLLQIPNNFVFGGVTGMAALVAKLTPLSASAFSSAAI